MMNIVVFKVKEDLLFLYPGLTTEEKVGLEMNGTITSYQSNEPELAISQFFDLNQVDIIDTVSAEAILLGTQSPSGQVEETEVTEEVHEQYTEKGKEESMTQSHHKDLMYIIDKFFDNLKK